MTWSLVQKSTVQTQTVSGTLTCTISASTAGNLLLAKIQVEGSSAQPTGVTSGFTERVFVQETTTPQQRSCIWENLNNAGGITSVSATLANSGAMIVEEWTCPNAATASFDKSGTASNASPVATFNITSAALTANNELAVTVCGYRFSTSTNTVITAGSGFTQQGAWNSGTKAVSHAAFDSEADTGSSNGSTITDAVAFSVTGAGSQAGVIACYIQGTPLAGTPLASTRARVPQPATRPILGSRLISAQPPPVTLVPPVQVRPRVTAWSTRPARRVQQPLAAPQGQPLPIYAKPATRSHIALMDWRPKRTQPRWPYNQVSGPVFPPSQRPTRRVWWMDWRPKRTQPRWLYLQVSGPVLPPVETRPRRPLADMRRVNRAQAPLRVPAPPPVGSRLRALAFRWRRQSGAPLAVQAPAVAVLPPAGLPRKAAWFHLRPKRTQTAALAAAAPPVVVIQAGLPAKARWLAFRHKRTQQANIPGAPPPVPLPPAVRTRRIIWAGWRRTPSAQFAPLIIIPKTPPAGPTHKAVWFERRYKRTQQMPPRALLAPFAGLARKVAWFDRRPVRTQRFAPFVFIPPVPKPGLARKITAWDWRRKRTQMFAPPPPPPPPFQPAESVPIVSDPRDGTALVTDVNTGLATALDPREGVKLTATDISEGRSLVTDPRDGKASVQS